MAVDARTKSYRAIQSKLWSDLERQYATWTGWEQERLAFDDKGTFDDSRWWGPINLQLDELLSHLPPDRARRLVSDLGEGWALDPTLVLYKQDLARRAGVVATAVQDSLPDTQWGAALVSPVVAVDVSQWHAWVRRRLTELGITDEAAFRKPEYPPPKVRPKSASTRFLAPAAAVAAIGLAAYVGYRVFSVRKASPELPAP
jgi:hypothetical protein